MLKGVIIGFNPAVETAYLPALTAQKGTFDICAVCDPSAERLKKAKALLPDARLYESPKALFSKEERLDLAVIASPAGRHAEHAMMALGNRTHVLCEAPLCLSMKELDGLWSESVRADRCVFTVHGPENSPQLITLKRVIGEKLLGHISYASLVFLRHRPAEAGIMADCGWQASYLAGELLGGEPLSLAARLQSAQGGESAAVCQLHFSGGAVHIRLAAGSHADRTKALLCGDKGLAQLDEDLLTLDLKDLAPETIRFKERFSDAPRAEWLAGALRDFLAAVNDPALREKNFRETKNCVKFLKNSAYSDSINSAAVPL
jgi:predicted dehydrogenase